MMREFKLVPASMLLDKETIGAINFHCGDGADGQFGEYSDGLLWVGTVTDDDGKEVYGLHLATAEYPEEGSTTLVEFAAPAPPACGEAEVKRFYLDATDGQRAEMVESPEGHYCEFDHVTRLTAERDALQQRLNAADQRIDELTPRVSEHPEGKRERFEKWVMATRHPVFGFLDGRSLARGDERTGYADEYVQGLWVAYLAFGGFASRDDSIGWLKRIDGIGQNRAELIYSMGFRRLAD